MAGDNADILITVALVLFSLYSGRAIYLDIAEDSDGKTWYYIHWIDVSTAEPEAAGEAIKGRLERGLRRVWE